MYLRDIVRLSYLNIFRQKTRNFLNISAVAIGVSSVLLVSSLGTGGEKIINTELQKLGLRGISVFQNQNPNSAPLYAEDAASLEKRFDQIEKTLPIVLETGKLKFNKITSDAVLFGVGENPESVYRVTLLYGRTPNYSDINNKKRVVVIDDELAEKAYRRKNVVGKTITIKFNERSEKFSVIGVIRSQKDGINQFLGNGLPDFVYLPYSTLNELRNKNCLSQIALSCSDEYNSDGSEFAKYLSKIKSAPGSYSSKNLSTKVDEIKGISKLVSSVMSAIAAISLIVAGIGIMNAMFSATAERKREIGILMAIGAKEDNILLCFLFEAVIIIFFGGALGTSFAFFILSTISNTFSISLMFELKTFLIIEALSFFCGILFSIIPAVKASKLSPISALERK